MIKEIHNKGKHLSNHRCKLPKYHVQEMIKTGIHKYNTRNYYKL